MPTDDTKALLAGKSNEHEQAAGMKPRRCTDILCLLVFFGFLGGLIYILQYAIANGDVRRLSHGFNFKGKLCGVDPGYEDRPYLYFCPSGVPIPGTDPPIPSSLDLLHPICVNSCPVSGSQSFLCYGGATVKEGDATNNEGDYTKTITYDFVRTDAYESYEFMHRYCIPKADALAKQVMTSIGDGVVPQAMMKVGTLRAGYPALALSTAIAFALGYLYLFLLREFAKALVYTCMLVLIMGSAVSGGYLLSVADAGGVGEGTGDGPTCYVVGVSLLVMSVIFLGLFAVKRKALATGIACVEGACEAIFSMPSLLLQPAFEIVTKIVVLGGMLYGFMWVMSTGDVKSSSATIGGVRVHGLSRTFDYTDEQLAFLGYWLFGIFWITELFTALGQFVVSYCVVLWYFSDKDSNGRKRGPPFPLFKGVFVGIFFHLGTLAMGAFCIAMLRVVRIVLQYVAKQAKQADNAVLEIIAKLLLCCVMCFERFGSFLNNTAYMDVALRSSNFCAAAKNAFTMITSEIATIALLNGACAVFQVVGAALISGFGGFLTFLMVTELDTFTYNESAYYIADPVFISIAAGVICLVIAMAFMVIFDQTADTMLYCFVYEKKSGSSRYAPESLATLISSS
ncbi:unnamed protein product [Amoebophrya sp. A120]|nr:unnamed protein product [Amoebophrya sp. A120]|eukprot:GSA120T00008953001.1